MASDSTGNNTAVPIRAKRRKVFAWLWGPSDYEGAQLHGYQETISLISLIIAEGVSAFFSEHGTVLPGGYGRGWAAIIYGLMSASILLQLWLMFRAAVFKDGNWAHIFTQHSVNFMRIMFIVGLAGAIAISAAIAYGVYPGQIRDMRPVRLRVRDAISIPASDPTDGDLIQVNVPMGVDDFPDGAKGSFLITVNLNDSLYANWMVVQLKAVDDPTRPTSIPKDGYIDPGTQSKQTVDFGLKKLEITKEHGYILNVILAGKQQVDQAGDVSHNSQSPADAVKTINDLRDAALRVIAQPQ